MWNFGLAAFVYYSVVRPFYKWILRLITGRCELLRITFSEHKQPHRTLNIEYSLKHSKSYLLRSILTDDLNSLDQTVSKIIELKSIKYDLQQMFSEKITASISQITGYHHLFNEVEHLRKTTYMSSNNDHEMLLIQLWNSLVPHSPLESRITHQWGNIGFQGDDPATDFRGMGLLGLENLVYFSTKHTDVARRLLSHSLHPQYGYSFAIVGINVTSMAYQLLKDGLLKTHFYCMVQGPPQIEDFHLVYVHLFYEFDRFWRDSKPVNIMEFNVIREKFNCIVIDQLQSESLPLAFQFHSDPNSQLH